MADRQHETAHRIAVLGDSRRREILETLSRGPSSVAELAERLPVTRSAVSQHLGVLKDAGRVRHEKIGTRHIYEVDPRGVEARRDYLASLWQQALSSFKAIAEARSTKGRPAGRGRTHGARRGVSRGPRSSGKERR